MLDFLDDSDVLDEPLTSLEIELTTVDAGDAGSADWLWVNVVFTDRTRLYEPTNRWIGQPPGRGDSQRYELGVPDGVTRRLGDIAEVFVRKSGDNGWFVGSVLLFANGHARPLLGNRHANQFLDDDDDVLDLREWSTSSFCVAPTSGAQHPLPRSGYRLLGPVIGQVSDTTADVLYRVDREGTYRFVVTDAVSGATAADITTDVDPTARFELTGLQPDRQYDFQLRFLRAGTVTTVAGASGSLRTYPAESAPGRFAMAFGSCANPNEQVAQGSWTAIRSLVQSPPAGIEPVRLFVHLGDSFYFYDHMTEEVVRNEETMHAAHVSMRRHLEFLDLARTVPCCGVWDDHDFAQDDTDSTDLSDELRSLAVDTWKRYWGNHQTISRRHDHGLTTRISHGLVDVYLLDGRFNRNKDEGICFGKDMIEDLLTTIANRSRRQARVVILATGSSWTHQLDDDTEYYGDPAYDDERNQLFAGLGVLMGRSIAGLVLLSGDEHINEIFHVNLGNGRMAPEFMCTPLTLNTGLSDDGRSIEGERVASFPSGGDDGRRGFATLTIDTTDPDPEGNWTATIRYYQEAAATMYYEGTYALDDGQFLPT